MRTALVLVTLALRAHAQVQTDWRRTYDGVTGENDSAHACAVDAVGNVYVVGIGSSPGAASTRCDFLVAKYSPNGAQLWAVEQDFAGADDGAEACALTSTGDVYVLGWMGSPTSSAMVLMKFGQAGAWLWTRTVASAGAYSSRPGNVVVDDNDNAIVCGAIYSASTGNDAVFQSYSPSGALNWSRVVDGGFGGSDVASRVQCLPNGEIVGVGELTLSLYDSDLAAWKLDGSGIVLWTSTCDGGVHFRDGAWTLAVSGSSKLLAGGFATSATYNSYDWMLAQIDVATGAVDWSNTYDAAGFQKDQVTDVAVDRHGVWWVTGQIDLGYGGVRGMTRRYGSDGALLSSHRWPSAPAGSVSRPSALRVGEAGQVWVLGVRTIIEPPPWYSSIKAFVLQYDAEGNLDWTYDAGASGPSLERVYDLRVAPSARLALVGDTTDSLTSNVDAFVTQIDLTHVPHGYCTAKTTSNGCEPRVEFVGTPSASATSGFVVRALELRNLRNGLLFYGVSSQAAPFHGGTLCISSPLARTPTQNSGGNPLPANDCSGTFSIDMNAFAHGSSAAALHSVGTDVYCQFWGLDPGFAAPNSVMLSNALAYTVRP